MRRKRILLVVAGFFLNYGWSANICLGHAEEQRGIQVAGATVPYAVRKRRQRPMQS